MRFALLISTALAIPVAAGAQGMCAVPPPAQADKTSAAPAKMAQVAPAFRSDTSPAEIGQPNLSKPPAPVTASSGEAPLETSDAISHIRSAGASIIDLSVDTGLRAIAARNKDVIMFARLTPDGAAYINGIETDLTEKQLLDFAPDLTKRLPTLHGVKAYYVRSGPQYQVFYVDPNNSHLIPGVLRDAHGAELTLSQLAGIPGAIPTITIGPVGSPPRPPAASTADEQARPAASSLETLSHAAFSVTGPATAPKLWMIFDPRCSVSIRAREVIQPFVDQSRIQLAVVPVSILDYEDQGISTVSAQAILSASDMLAAWKSWTPNDPIAPSAASRLQTNEVIRETLTVQGTPTFFWQRSDGSVGRADGMTSDLMAFITHAGS